MGRAADAAEATRNASASTNDPGIDSALRRRKTASPRRLHDTEMSSQAAQASFVQCVFSPSQRPTRHRVTNGRRASWGRKATTAAAAIPATATTAKPARVVQWLEPAAATDAIGVRAALSSIPSTIRLSPSVPSPVFVPGKRLTTAIRRASSTRPGSAIPPTHAAPPAKASAPAVGRSCAWKSRCQPHALKA